MNCCNDYGQCQQGHNCAAHQVAVHEVAVPVCTSLRGEELGVCHCTTTTAHTTTARPQLTADDMAGRDIAPDYMTPWEWIADLGRSAAAAREIKDLISASVERVEQGSALVDQAGTTMTGVVEAIARVTSIMGEISSASNDQSSGVNQIGQAISQLDQTTQQNAALVEESAAAAQSLEMQAKQLIEVVGAFKLDAYAGQRALPNQGRLALSA